MKPVLFVSALLLLPALALAPPASAARGKAAHSARGVECHANPAADDRGETHWCLFDPRQRGRHDFTTRNGRAGYVVSMLGPDCGLIEILDDVEQPRGDGKDPPLHRVSVACTDD